jgi:formate dehydrogenase maturation protein FdhE
MTSTALDASPWAARRQRAAELAERWPFAAEVLAFYATLCDVQERAFIDARTEAPRGGDPSAYIAERVVPRIVEVSAAHGPASLMRAALERASDAGMGEVVRAWLRGDELNPIDRFLARASANPVLEALGDDAGAAREGERDERYCPVCGGLPQLSYFAASPEDLVTGNRHLQCSRCAHAWKYTRMTCASCGEKDTSRLTVYAERGTTEAERTAGGPNATVIKPGTPQNPADVGARFPHMRIDGCTTCSRYLLTVDLTRDGWAVPMVDEFAALPLDLHARNAGFTKVVPNLMGF